MLRDIIDRARIDPNHPAARDLKRELSYAELIGEAERFGTGLWERGVREGNRLALLFPNSTDFVVAALGCLWVGAIFVPLAVTDPESRLETVVADGSPTLIITSSVEDAEHPETLGGVPLVPIDLILEGTGEPAELVGAGPRVAYIIYTSGTTGSPKGVQIGTEAFAAAVHSTANALGLNAATRTLCVSPFHFDGSYANVFPTLISGGTLIIRPRDALLFPRTFFKAVAEEQITYSGFTPSYLRLLLASRQMKDLNASSLEKIALGGEALSIADLQALWSFAPTVRAFNRYGPTETTIAVTNVELTPALLRNGTVPIGQPHPGVSFALVDDNGRVIEEENKVGELFIGGNQLMDGYWAAPELTRDVMRVDVMPGESMYRTGDLVYRDDQGNYVYVDRTDRVVKRSGVRISLVELSASMNKLAGVVAAACVIFDRDGEVGIAAFVVTDVERTVLDLRRAASQLIPESMLPDLIELVPAMPLNRSNLLDESQLLAAAGLRKYHPTPPSPDVN